MRQVCQLCALDDFILMFAAEDEPGAIDYVCENPKCGHSWRSTATSSALYERSGIAEEYGVYDDLLECIHPDDPWIEHGVVEYRYARLRPDLYLNEFIPRWGHTVSGPRKYTVSAFLAGALGSLSRSGDLAWEPHPATGYWSYNRVSSFWTRRRDPLPDTRITWEQFARTEGIDPETWPLPS